MTNIFAEPSMDASLEVALRSHPQIKIDPDEEEKKEEEDKK